MKLSYFSSLNGPLVSCWKVLYLQLNQILSQILLFLGLGDKVGWKDHTEALLVSVCQTRSRAKSQGIPLLPVRRQEIEAFILNKLLSTLYCRPEPLRI